MADGALPEPAISRVLLKQEHVNAEKYGGQTIEEIRTETAAKVGENVVIRRFTRFAVGEE